MSDPTQPAPADPAAPAVQPPAAPSVATQPPASPPPPVVAPRVLNPYAAMPSRPAAPAAVAPPDRGSRPSTAPLRRSRRIVGLECAASCARDVAREQLAGMLRGRPRQTVHDARGRRPASRSAACSPPSARTGSLAP
jgi:hypothetical protein